MIKTFEKRKNIEVPKSSARELAKNRVIIDLLPKGKLKIFEASAGKARLALLLYKDGHEVLVSNYILRKDLPLEEIFLDLNSSDITIPHAPFDVIICREVIEHVENIPHVLRKLRQHLKANGLIILTLPNKLCLRSRLYHLFTGFCRGLPSPINLKHPLGEEHINLIAFPELAYFLEKTGYQIQTAISSEKYWLDYLAMVLKPLFWLTTHYFVLLHKPLREGHEVETAADKKRNASIRDILLSADLFIGKDLIVTAKNMD